MTHELIQLTFKYKKFMSFGFRIVVIFAKKSSDPFYSEQQKNGRRL